MALESLRYQLPSSDGGCGHHSSSEGSAGADGLQLSRKSDGGYQSSSGGGGGLEASLSPDDKSLSAYRQLLRNVDLEAPSQHTASVTAARVKLPGLKFRMFDCMSSSVSIPHSLLLILQVSSVSFLLPSDEMLM
jgi:hypothetical protein